MAAIDFQAALPFFIIQRGKILRKLFAQRCARLGSQNEFKIVDDIAKAEAMGQQVVRLNLGEPDNDSADNINEKGEGNAEKEKCV